MSRFNKILLPWTGLRGSIPEFQPRPVSGSRIAPLAMIAGVGFLLILPGKAKADHNDDSYGHAEITMGFPIGQVTVGRTWGEHPREVVVEEVTHRYPQDYDDDDEDEQVIVEKRRHGHRHKKVVIIERYEERRHYDRDVEVRRVYVEPERIYCPPPRPYCAPSRTIIVTPGYGSSTQYESRRSDNYEIHPRVRHESNGNGQYQGGQPQPRDLFPEDHGRPMRTRGVQQVAQLGNTSH